jgi:hypothetical protein
VFNRYWSHVVQCTSCSAALKAMRTLEVALQVASVGFFAVANGTVIKSAVQRTVAVAVSAAVLCFAASRWLYFQDYVHADK